MRRITKMGFAAILALSTSLSAAYVQPIPFSKKISGNTVKSVNSNYYMPVISWGDVLFAIDNKKLFPSGIKLVDNPIQQINDVIAGKTPFIRQTVGSGVMIVDTLNNLGVEMEVFHSVSDSNGGDVIVSKTNKIKSLDDLKKMKTSGEKPTIAIQYGGPHIGWLVQLLDSVGMTVNDVNIKFTEELFGNNSPETAITEDNSIDMAFVISTSAAMITEGEYAIPNVKVLTSTKVMNKAITDVIYVRKDWADANRDQLQKIRRAYLDSIKDVKNKSLVNESAKMLFGDGEQAIADFEGLISEIKFHNEEASNKFLFSPTNPNNLTNKVAKITTSFRVLGLISSDVKIKPYNWDVAVSNSAKIRELDTAKTAQLEREVAQLDNAGQGQVIFKKKIYFSPNQSVFSDVEYAKDFEEAIKLSSTYGGAILKVVGNVDPSLVRAWSKAVEFKEQGNDSGLDKVEAYLLKTTGERQNFRSKSVNLIKSDYNMIRNSAKTISKERANSVKRALVEYAKKQNFDLDASRLVVIGEGGDSPVYDKPANQDQFRANIRVEFQITNYNAELDTFSNVQDF